MSDKRGRSDTERVDDSKMDRRTKKIIKTDIRAASPLVTASKIESVKTIYNQEESEVDSRTPELDNNDYMSACNIIRDKMKEIYDLKCSQDSDPVGIEKKKIHATLQFVTIKRLKRLAHIRCLKARENTDEEKCKIDHHHLQLQNLLYEISHLQKEINKCLQFKSKDEDIQLVEIEDFYAKAPIDISKPSLTTKDLHELRIARLDWELTQRKKLTEKYEESQKKLEAVNGEIQKKKDYLENLSPKLDSILQATKPVQEYLGMPYDEVKEQHKTALYLPTPLYVLYMQVSAFKDTCDKNLQVFIEGDVEVAKATDETPIQFDEDSDSDNEEPEAVTKKRRHRCSDDDKKLVKKSQAFKTHPLSVVLLITGKDDSELKIIFLYMLNLGIVTIKLMVKSNKNVVSISADDIMSPISLLSCLYPDDLGLHSPNPSNCYFLKRLGLGKFSDYANDIGIPYNWSQWLCGLEFLGIEKESSRPKVDSSVTTSLIEDAIRKLRNRVRSRILLQEQISFLEKSQIYLDKDSVNLFPARIISKVVDWKRKSFSEFSDHSLTKVFIDAGTATENDFYFELKAERANAKLSALVIISTDYPNIIPVFILTLTWDGVRNRFNDHHIKDLEAEINFYSMDTISKGCKDRTLVHQIQKLVMCLDVYLESEVEEKYPGGYPNIVKEKIFTRSSKGRSRKKAYVYNAQLGFFCPRDK